MMNEDLERVALATELTMAWLSNPNTRASQDEVVAFLNTMDASVKALSDSPGDVQEPAAEAKRTPAVSVRKSLASPDHIVSMIDGRSYRSLTRHVRANGMTPEQYRAEFGLRPDYPMVAKNYSDSRREIALKLGLGRKGRGGTPTPADAPAMEAATAEAPAEASAEPRRRRGRGAAQAAAAPSRRPRRDKAKA